MEVRIKTNFREASAKFEEQFNARKQKVIENVLNNQAFAARAEVQKQIKQIFRSPEDTTVNSVRVQKVQPNCPLDMMVARVYISDDLPKGSVQPATYLLTEETGGTRSLKRSEKILLNAGILPAGVQTVPGPSSPQSALPLDAHGQPTGAGVVQMLSRLKAFGEGGYRANASDATRKKIARAARSYAAKQAKGAGGDKDAIRLARKNAFVPVVNRTGNEFFLAKSKLTDGFSGVFKLVGRGQVQPVVWFATKRPTYEARFPFRKIVAASLRSTWNESVKKALNFVGKSNP